MSIEAKQKISMMNRITELEASNRLLDRALRSIATEISAGIFAREVAIKALGKSPGFAEYSKENEVILKANQWGAEVSTKFLCSPAEKALHLAIYNLGRTKKTCECSDLLCPDKADNAGEKGSE